MAAGTALGEQREHAVGDELARKVVAEQQRRGVGGGAEEMRADGAEARRLPALGVCGLSEPDRRQMTCHTHTSS